MTCGFSCNPWLEVDSEDVVVAQTLEEERCQRQQHGKPNMAETL